MTQFVGSPVMVANRLARYAVTDADELLVTIITHRHEDWVCSQALLAEEWERRYRGTGVSGTTPLTSTAG